MSLLSVDAVNVSTGHVCCLCQLVGPQSQAFMPRKIARNKVLPNYRVSIQNWKGCPVPPADIVQAYTFIRYLSIHVS